MTILAAVDGERAPDQVVEIGHDLAQQFETEFVVVHVMDQDVYEERRDATSDMPALTEFASGIGYEDSTEERTRSASTDRHTYTIEDAERDAANVARDVVEETIDRVRDVTFQGRVGDTVDEILAESERRDAQYLVVGGRKRSPTGKALFGDVTQSILLNAECPVVSLLHDE